MGTVRPKGHHGLNPRMPSTDGLLVSNPGTGKTRASPRPRLGGLTFLLAITAAAIAHCFVDSAFARLANFDTIFWIATLAAVELFHVPAWKGIQLSLSVPMLLSVAMLYPAPLAG